MVGGERRPSPGARLLPAALARGGRLRAVVRRTAPAAATRRARTAGSTRRPAACCAPTCRVPGSASPAAGDARRARRAAGRRLGGRRGRRPAPPQGGAAAWSRRSCTGTSSAACARWRTSSDEACAVPSARRPRTRPEPGRPTIPKELVPRHVAIVMDGNGRWAKAARAAAHQGPRGGRGLAVRRRRGRDRDRREGDLGLRVLDRELDALARRGPLPDGLQPRRDPAAPRRDARARRPGALGGPRAAAVAVGDQGAPGRRGADPATTTC